MGACAGVLERGRRLLGRDASATDCGEAAVHLVGWEAVGFRAGQNHSDLTAKRGKPMRVEYLRPHAPEGGSGLDQHAAM